MTKVSRALISVSDKTGLKEFGKGLQELGIELLASSGSAKALEQAGCKVTPSQKLTGFSELLEGRVKTLHPALHAGILARRDSDAHMEQLKSAGFGPIDLVIVNLYPFEATVAKEGVSLEEAVENIDIGGVALIRSAAKNHDSVTVVVDPADYVRLLDELRTRECTITAATRQQLAVKAFMSTAAYDAVISGFLSRRFIPAGPAFPDRLVLSYRKKQSLRYGENPHQSAAVYLEDSPASGSLVGAKQVNGKDPSHNNYLDFDSALGFALEFDEPCCAVIKHRNACGCACGKTLAEAIERAVMADSLSAFGGMVAVNRVIDEDAARAILKTLESAKKFDGLVAPGFSGNALKIIKDKPSPFPGKNLLVLETGPSQDRVWRPSIRGVSGGLLLQDPDTRKVAKEELKTVTKRSPTPKEEEDLFFAWGVCKHTVSNAIVFAKDKCTVGIGPGQTNRVGSVMIAARMAGEKSRGAVLGSDAFFPYPDGIEEAAKAGITAIMQPGGSARDADAIQAADKAGIAMVFTGIRHFKH